MWKVSFDGKAYSRRHRLARSNVLDVLCLSRDGACDSAKREEESGLGGGEEE